MKKLIIIAAAILLGVSNAAAGYKPGVSLGMFESVTPEVLEQVKAAGIEYVEVIFNPFWRNQPENELYTRAFRMKAMIEEAGLKVWSCHMPFSRALDISVTDSESREQNVAFMERMIRLSAIFGPQRIVLHPSSEPISDEERPVRLQNSANSIGRLSLAAKDAGAVLCIENLPRTCLGRNSEEMMFLIGNYPEVMVCFDTNHLLIESHADFFRGVGDRIAHVHVSDYDFMDERHWLPGRGQIDWSDFIRRLRDSGYDGVFMHEISQRQNASPQDVIDAFEKIFSDGKQKKK